MAGVMHKTTLYLPDDLKAAVQRLAAETGPTEAAIIREGIELATSQHTPPLPTIPIVVSDDPSPAEPADEHLTGFGEQVIQVDSGEVLATAVA